jgi:hypothetical protein
VPVSLPESGRLMLLSERGTIDLRYWAGIGDGTNIRSILPFEPMMGNGVAANDPPKD